jgi:Tol biopolymer transport system component
LGDLLIAAKDERNNDMLATVSLQSRQTYRLGADSVRGTSLSLSPDGRQIAFSGRIGVRQPRIFLMDADGGQVRRLVPEATGVRVSSYEEHSPRWSHDGARIVFVTNRTGNYEIHSVRIDGSDLQRLTNNSAQDWRVSTSPDGPKIAFERLVGAGDGDLVVSLLDGTGESVYTTPQPMPTMRVSESKPALLRGGTALVFARGAPRLDESAGQTLALFDLTTGLAGRDLVAAVRDTEQIFAVSPDGQRIAYHLRAIWGKKNNIITIIDLSGNVVASIAVNGVRDILELSWGASPPPRNQELP